MTPEELAAQRQSIMGVIKGARTVPPLAPRAEEHDEDEAPPAEPDPEPEPEPIKAKYAEGDRVMYAGKPYTIKEPVDDPFSYRATGDESEEEIFLPEMGLSMYDGEQAAMEEQMEEEIVNLKTENANLKDEVAGLQEALKAEKTEAATIALKAEGCAEDLVDVFAASLDRGEGSWAEAAASLKEQRPSAFKANEPEPVPEPEPAPKRIPDQAAAPNRNGEVAGAKAKKGQMTPDEFRTKHLNYRGRGFN